MIPQGPPSEPRLDNVVPFPPQPPPPERQPPWPGSQLDEGQLLNNALLALWWGYGWGGGEQVGSLTAAPPERLGWMGFDPTRRYPRWGMPDVLLALFFFLFGGFLFAVPVVLLTQDTGVLNIAALLGSWVGALGYLFFVSRVKGQGRLSLDFGFRFKWIDLPIGLGLAVVTLVVSYVVRILISNAFSESLTSNSEEIFSGQDSGIGVVILAIMAAVGAPFVEELLFRGLTLRAIEKRLGAIVGVMGSATIFGLLHWGGGTLGSNVSLVAGIGTYGVTFAIVDRWVGRLAPSIYAHMILNSFAATVTVYEFFSGSKIS